jgi:hypothetical protein
MSNPDNDSSGMLTLEEITGTSPAGLLSVAITDSSLSANLPLKADLLGYGAGASLVMEGDPLRGRAPELRLEGADISDFSNFANLTPNSLLAGLDQIASLLSQLIGADILNTRIPLVDTSVGEVLDFGRAFSDQVTSLLSNSDGSAAFQDIGQLENLLNRVLVRATGAALPENGVLPTDAVFNIILNDSAPVPVTLSAAATSAFSSRLELIDYIDTTLKGISSLDGVTTGITADGYLFFNAPEDASSFRLTVDPADPANSAFTALGLLAEQVNALSGLTVNFDASNDLLLFTMSVNHNFAGFEAGFDFEHDFQHLANFSVSNSHFSVDAQGGLNITFGIDLSSADTVLKARRPLADCQLADDAHFQLLLNGFAGADDNDGQEPVRVEVVLTSSARCSSQG